MQSALGSRLCFFFVPAKGSPGRRRHFVAGLSRMENSDRLSLLFLFLCETGHVVRCVKEDQGVERMKEDHGVESRACADPKVAMTLRYDFLIPTLQEFVACGAIAA